MSDRDRHERGPKGAVAAILGMAMVGLVVAAALARQRNREELRISGNGGKGGTPDGASPAEGAISDFKMPEDMRSVIPEPPSYAPA